MGVLTGRVDGQPVVAVELHDDAVGLHRHGRQPLVEESTLHDDLGVVEDCRVLAEVELDGEVRSVLGEEDGRIVGQRGLGIDDGRQRVVVDDHQLGGVDGLRPRRGDHNRQHVADEADDVVGEGRACQGRRNHGEPLHRFEAEVVGRVHRHDPGHLLRVARVDRLDLRVRDRGSHERDVKQTFDVEVVEVAGLAAEDAGVLGALDGIAENRSRGRGHGRNLYSRLMERAADTVVIRNRRARYDYSVLESFECGIVLAGSEVKSIRAGRANLQDAYARVDDGELWLHGMHIAPYEFSRAELEPVRRRKLLLHRKEIDTLARATGEKGVTLVPLRVYFKDGRAKVELAVAKGKRAYDKRRTIAERDAKREAERALKGLRD